MKRRIFTVLASCCVAATVLSGCTSGSSGGGDVTLMMDVGLLPKHALFYAAVDHGFYRAEGLDVSIVPGTGSKDTSLAVASGRVDFGFADFGQSTLARSEGADVKQLGLVQAETAYATITTSDTGIRTWADLKGKRVATEAGGAMTSIFPQARERAGLAESDVEVIAASGQSKIPGLLNRQWDATLAFYTSDEPVLISKGYDPVVLKWSDLGISMYGNGIIASDQLIADDPDKVTRFMSATMKGVKWACDNPEQSATALLNNVREMDQASADAGVAAACSLLWNAENATSGLGTMTDEGASHVIDMTAEFLKADNAKLSPSDLYTNKFLDTTLTESTIIDEPLKTTR